MMLRTFSIMMMLCGVLYAQSAEVVQQTDKNTATEASCTLELRIKIPATIVDLKTGFAQRPLIQTDRELDLAIEGEGFFQVILSDDSIAYTRAGNFKFDRDRNIVTAQGHRLVPGIVVPPEITSISVDVNGTFWGFTPATPEALTEEIGRIELARFVNPAGLEAIGDNLYRQTTASGDPITGSPGTDPKFGLIRQGFLEETNLDVIRELINMITTQEACEIEININITGTADEILQAINNLRR